MNKTWKKLLSLNLVLVMLLSMSVGVGAEQTLQVGDNEVISEQAYTFVPDQDGVYLFSGSESIQVEATESLSGFPYSSEACYYTLSAGVSYQVTTDFWENSGTLTIEKATPQNKLFAGYYRLVEFGEQPVTYNSFFGGHHIFESPVAFELQQNSQAVASLGKGVYKLEGGTEYTLVAEQSGTAFIKAMELDGTVKTFKNNQWVIVTSAKYSADLLLLDANNKVVRNAAFVDYNDHANTVIFYAKKSQKYLLIDASGHQNSYENTKIRATSIDCEVLKENKKTTFTGNHEGAWASFTPERSGEFVWNCGTAESAMILDKNLSVVGGSPKYKDQSATYKTLLNKGETYYFAGSRYVQEVTVKNTWSNTLDVFKDIKKSDWFVKNSALDFAFNMKIFKGVSDTTFEPNSAVTRGMFVTVLGRLHGVADSKKITKFTDVKKNDWYSGFVKWAADNNIVNGTTSTTFAPNEFVTREQICTMMERYCKFAKIALKKDIKEIKFSDAGQISSYAKKAVTACQRGGIVNGKGNNMFDPKGQATRAEVATILMNFYRNYK